MVLNVFLFLALRSDCGLKDEHSHREAMTTKSAHFDDRLSFRMTNRYKDTLGNHVIM